MSVYQDSFYISTSGNCDMNDITSKVKGIIKTSQINKGICHVFNVGSTGIIGTIEFEPGLEEDFPQLMNKLIPESRKYGHELTWQDGNGHSHLQASLAGPEITLPLSGGKLFNGTWQQIFHYEADVKPRQRQIVVSIIGE